MVVTKGKQVFDCFSEAQLYSFISLTRLTFNELWCPVVLPVSYTEQKFINYMVKILYTKSYLTECFPTVDIDQLSERWRFPLPQNVPFR